MTIFVRLTWDSHNSFHLCTFKVGMSSKLSLNTKIFVSKDSFYHLSERLTETIIYGSRSEVKKLWKNIFLQFYWKRLEIEYLHRIIELISSFFLSLTKAIVLVSTQKKFNEKLKQTVRNTLMSQLNQPFGKPSSRGPAEEINFIKKALQLVLEMGPLSTMVVAELMAQYVLATDVFRLVLRSANSTFADV